MKIIILTIYMNLGLVGCFDVIGYSGGSIMITCRHSLYGMGATFFCKVKSPNECEDVMYSKTQAQATWTQKERIYLFDDSDQALTVLFRQLRLQDSGIYRCGENAGWSVDINVNVLQERCCMEPNTMKVNSGNTVTINSYYPAKYKESNKLFFKLVGHRTGEVIRTDGPESQKDRFSMFDDRCARLLSVNISDVREDDGGVYFCGVWRRGVTVSSYVLFAEIQLNITANKHTTETPESTTDTHQPGCSVVIPVFICVTLLLTGGLVLMLYKLKKDMKQDSLSIQNRRNHVMDSDNDQHGNLLDVSADLVSQRRIPNTNQSLSVYWRRDPSSCQSYFVYQNLHPNTNESHSVYQNIHPNTRQLNSIYQSLDPNTRQSNSAYQSLDPNIN